MKYQKNIALRLRAMDFEFSSSINQKEDIAKNESALHYEVWRKPVGSLHIDITINHISKQVIVVLEPDEYVQLEGINTLNDVNLLERLVCGKKQEYINNEEWRSFNKEKPLDGKRYYYSQGNQFFKGMWNEEIKGFLLDGCGGKIFSKSCDYFHACH